MANPLPLPILHLVFPEEFYEVFLDKNNGNVETATKHISLILDLLTVTADEEYVNEAINSLNSGDALVAGDPNPPRPGEKRGNQIVTHDNVKQALQFAKNVRNASGSLNEGVLTLIEKAKDGRSRKTSIQKITEILNREKFHEILRDLIKIADKIMKAANCHNEYIELHAMTWKAALALFEKLISGMLNEMEIRGVDVVYALTGPGPKSESNGIIKKKVMEFLKNNENKYSCKEMEGNPGVLEIRKNTT